MCVSAIRYCMSESLDSLSVSLDNVCVSSVESQILKVLYIWYMILEKNINFHIFISSLQKFTCMLGIWSIVKTWNQWFGFLSSMKVRPERERVRIRVRKIPISQNDPSLLTSCGWMRTEVRSRKTTLAWGSLRLPKRQVNSGRRWKTKQWVVKQTCGLLT